ncbi:tyrosine-type recombinase/integrase [Arenibaculum sp.]|jgi:integrase|uniref:tyrosine-type recombinase/integrase n=1 Tax=Arenibaculum sp. TaxID=2865862 RepID=UPI0039C8B429
MRQFRGTGSPRASSWPEHVIGAAAADIMTALPRVGDFVPARDAPDRPLSASVLEHAWRKVRERAGIEGLRLHDLRHGLGTCAGQAGANVFLVREAPGHRTLAMSDRYVGRDADPLRQLADAVSGRVSAALGRSGRSTTGPTRRRQGTPGSIHILEFRALSDAATHVADGGRREKP